MNVPFVAEFGFEIIAFLWFFTHRKLLILVVSSEINRVCEVKN